LHSRKERKKKGLTWGEEGLGRLRSTWEGEKGWRGGGEREQRMRGERLVPVLGLQDLIRVSSGEKEKVELRYVFVGRKICGTETSLKKKKKKKEKKKKQKKKKKKIIGKKKKKKKYNAYGVVGGLLGKKGVPIFRQKGCQRCV